MINITLLGATGSIGVNTLDIIKRHPEQFTIFALAANTQVEKLFEQCCQFKPRYAVLSDTNAAEQLRAKLKAIHSETDVLAGAANLSWICEQSEVDYVVAAIVGAKGLLPTLAAIKAGKRVLLANKEPMVMAGGIFKQELSRSKAVLLPLDSEHNAIFQCLPSTKHNHPEIHKVIITASGGAFRDTPIAELLTVTPEQACTHPNWRMGRKITVDSATMVNKGLEVIEAHWLFGLPLEKIDVILHPQSTIHSIVEYIDGSMIAQLGSPDMRIPISYGLSWPKRITNGAQPVDLVKLGRLDFKPICYERYPCLKLAYEALKAGGTAPAIFNAANEVAVAAFLNRQIRFTDITTLITHALERISPKPYDDIATVLEADTLARDETNHYILNIF